VRWVSRQLVLPDLSRLDLLGLTNDGTWVIAELRRGVISTGVVLQALHYFLQIEAMSNADLAELVNGSASEDAKAADTANELSLLVPQPDENTRDYLLIVAGVGTDGSAEAAAATLAEHGFDVPVRVVSFELVHSTTGRRMLLREVDNESSRARRTYGAARPLGTLLDTAEMFGVRQGFLKIVSKLSGKGYRPYLKKTGLNFNLGSRAQVFWVKPVEGKIHIEYLSSNFPSLFGIDEGTAEARLGQKWFELPPQQAVEQIMRWVDTVEEFRRAATNQEETA
jgi:hypothetical protein